MMLSVVCMLVLSQVLVPHIEAQRPPYGRPWPDYFTQVSTEGSSTTARAATTTSTSGSAVTQAPVVGGGLGDRISPDVTFRLYDNVPIQGPDSPCIGCLYQLTRNGFIRTQMN